MGDQLILWIPTGQEKAKSRERARLNLKSCATRQWLYHLVILFNLFVFPLYLNCVSVSFIYQHVWQMDRNPSKARNQLFLIFRFCLCLLHRKNSFWPWSKELGELRQSPLISGLSWNLARLTKEEGDTYKCRLAVLGWTNSFFGTHSSFAIIPRLIMSHIRWSTTGLVCNIVAERANNDYDEKAAPPHSNCTVRSN